MKYRERKNVDDKIMKVITDLTVKCVCGHSVFLPNYVPKTNCKWCYRTVYNTNELGKKQKFKDDLKKCERKIKE